MAIPVHIKHWPLAVYHLCIPLRPSIECVVGDGILLTRWAVPRIRVIVCAFPSILLITQRSNLHLIPSCLLSFDCLCALSLTASAYHIPYSIKNAEASCPIHVPRAIRHGYVMLPTTTSQTDTQRTWQRFTGPSFPPVPISPGSKARPTSSHGRREVERVSKYSTFNCIM